MARGALPVGRSPAPSPWPALLVVTVLLTAGAVYVVWWLRTPADCTVLGPRSQQWTSGGYRPDARDACPVHSGEYVISIDTSAPGVVTYHLDDHGTPRLATLPLRRPDAAAVLRDSWSILLFCGSLFVLVAHLFVRRRTEIASAALLLLGTCLLTSSAATLLGLPGSAADSGWRWLFLGEVQVVYMLAWASLVVFGLSFPAPVSWLSRGRLLGVYLVPLLALGVVGAVALTRLGPVAGVGATIIAQGTLTVLAVITGAVISLRRFRSAGQDSVARQQLRLLGAGSWTASALVLAGWFVPELITGRPLLPQAWIGLPGLAFVAALGVGLLRYRLFDLDAVANRSIVYAGLTAAVVTSYLAVVTGLAAAV